MQGEWESHMKKKFGKNWRKECVEEVFKQEEEEEETIRKEQEEKEKKKKKDKRTKIEEARKRRM